MHQKKTAICTLDDKIKDYNFIAMPPLVSCTSVLLYSVAGFQWSIPETQHSIFNHCPSTTGLPYNHHVSRGTRFHRIHLPSALLHTSLVDRSILFGFPTSGLFYRSCTQALTPIIIFMIQVWGSRGPCFPKTCGICAVFLEDGTRCWETGQ